MLMLVLNRVHARDREVRSRVDSRRSACCISFFEKALRLDKPPLRIRDEPVLIR